MEGVGNVFVINSVALGDLKHLGTGDLGTDRLSLPYVNLAMGQRVIKVPIRELGKTK